MGNESSPMYRWRKVSAAQRTRILEQRQSIQHPLHSPRHVESDRTDRYMITAACFEHRPHVGHSLERLQDFSNRLCDVLAANCRTVDAWVVLPNHYHVMIDCPNLMHLFQQLQQLHGRTAFEWNGQEDCRGRKVWCKAAETEMKSEGHFYASINYVLNNPVRHGYCARWTEWPFSSAQEYLDRIGRAKALQIWKSYPLHDYGNDWDPPEL
ncbi:hypothetical protein NHH03_18035 [Stieleria sp. TO1_6]|uniref:hypothetical protein n=1 Tax=Stieleria tagensis TaxID=2956795 RepID=UPI00209B5920|nr:hypothetical protein [Stieleria tagensis]MCO8123651.1 hypothetical protein [Stieleria tagensis]